MRQIAHVSKNAYSNSVPSAIHQQRICRDESLSSSWRWRKTLDSEYFTPLTWNFIQFSFSSSTLTKGISPRRSETGRPALLGFVEKEACLVVCAQYQGSLPLAATRELLPFLSLMETCYDRFSQNFATRRSIHSRVVRTPGGTIGEARVLGFRIP